MPIKKHKMTPSDVARINRATAKRKPAPKAAKDDFHSPNAPWKKKLDAKMKGMSDSKLDLAILKSFPSSPTQKHMEIERARRDPRYLPTLRK